jgi:hypothetical protein
VLFGKGRQNFSDVGICPGRQFLTSGAVFDFINHGQKHLKGAFRVVKKKGEFCKWSVEGIKGI